MNFVNEHKFTEMIAAASRAAGSTAVNGANVDMSDFEGVAAIVEFGAIVATAVTSIKWQQSDTTTDTDFSDLAGTEVTVADDEDGQYFVSELYRPTKRYVRAVVSRGTADATIRSAQYVQFQPRKAPVTNATGYAASVNVSPAEGTA